MEIAILQQSIAEFIFKVIWSLLLLIAISAHLRFRGKLKQKSNLTNNLLVVVPYLIIFGWFSVRSYVGTYKPNIITQALGIFFVFIGTGGYIWSILYLKNNWAVSAAIKEGHTLVKNGPYKLIRHPMYSFMILTALGSGLLISNFLIILYTPVIAAIYYLRSRAEEEMLIKSLPGYREYMKNSKMLVPWLF